jgi:hypothetical protein
MSVHIIIPSLQSVAINGRDTGMIRFPNNTPQVHQGGFDSPNLYLKLLATKEQLEFAEKIDRIAIWAYPFTYIVLIISIVLFFR